MTIRADEWLKVEIPEELMEEFEVCDDRGYGSVCGHIHELKPNQTADYITANRESELAKHFEDEYGVDLDNREAIIKQINRINERMGQEF